MITQGRMHNLNIPCIIYYLREDFLRWSDAIIALTSFDLYVPRWTSYSRLASDSRCLHVKLLYRCINEAIS